MLYYSTNNTSSIVNFKEATIKGQAPDKGLYFPKTIPQIDKNLIKDIAQYTKEEIAFTVIAPYIGDEIPKNELEKIKNEDRLSREKLESIADTLRIDYDGKDDESLKKDIDAALKRGKEYDL